MGRVFKKTVPKPVPPNAEIVAKKNGEQAQWTDRRGKKYSAPVVTGQDGKPRIRVEAKTYTAKYRDGSGNIREHATGCRSKRSAEMVLAKLEQEAEKVRGGVIDPYVTIETDTVKYGTMGPFATADNGLIYDEQRVIVGVETPFVFSVDPDCPNGHVIPFVLTTTYRNRSDPDDSTVYERTINFEYGNTSAV